MLRNVTVVGAAGRMGRWLCRFLSSEGFNVLANDVDVGGLAELKRLNPNVELCSLEVCAARSEVIIISVPINSFEHVVRELRPHVREHHLIVDVCSVKKLPVDIMHKFLDRGIKLGTHPLFGPGSAVSMSGRKVVLTPITNEEFSIASQIVDWVEGRGGYGIIMSPVEHDELMSVIMGIPHAVGLILAKYLSDFDVSMLEFMSTPTYNFMFKYSTAILSGNLDLYVSIQKYLGVGRELRRLVEVVNNFVNGVEERPEVVLNELKALYSKIVSKGIDVKESYNYMYRLYEESLR